MLLRLAAHASDVSRTLVTAHIASLFEVVFVQVWPLICVGKRYGVRVIYPLGPFGMGVTDYLDSTCPKEPAAGSWFRNIQFPPYCRRPIRCTRSCHRESDRRSSNIGIVSSMIRNTRCWYASS